MLIAQFKLEAGPALDKVPSSEKSAFLEGLNTIRNGNYKDQERRKKIINELAHSPSIFKAISKVAMNFSNFNNLTNEETFKCIRHFSAAAILQKLQDCTIASVLDRTLEVNDALHLEAALKALNVIKSDPIDIDQALPVIQSDVIQSLDKGNDQEGVQEFLLQRNDDPNAGVNVKFKAGSALDKVNNIYTSIFLEGLNIIWNGYYNDEERYKKSIKELANFISIFKAITSAASQAIISAAMPNDLINDETFRCIRHLADAGALSNSPKYTTALVLKSTLDVKDALHLKAALKALNVIKSDPIDINQALPVEQADVIQSIETVNDQRPPFTRFFGIKDRTRIPVTFHAPYEKSWCNILEALPLEDRNRHIVVIIQRDMYNWDTYNSERWAREASEDLIKTHNVAYIKIIS